MGGRRGKLGQCNDQQSSANPTVRVVTITLERVNCFAGEQPVTSMYLS